MAAGVVGALMPLGGPHATERARYSLATRLIGHAEILIAGARMMISDEYPDFGALSAQSSPGRRGCVPRKISSMVIGPRSWPTRSATGGSSRLA